MRALVLWPSTSRYKCTPLEQHPKEYIFPIINAVVQVLQLFSKGLCKITFWDECTEPTSWTHP